MRIRFICGDEYGPISNDLEKWCKKYAQGWITYTDVACYMMTHDNATDMLRLPWDQVIDQINLQFDVKKQIWYDKTCKAVSSGVDNAVLKEG